MKKNLTIAVALLATSLPLSAQNWSLGVHSGGFVFGDFVERKVRPTIGGVPGDTVTMSLSAATRPGLAVDVQHDFSRRWGVRLEGAFANAPAEQKSAVCLNCHASSRHLTFWESGKHSKNDVSCNNCHSIHDTPVDKNRKLLKKNEATAAPFRTTVRQLEYETCTSCHKQVRAQIGKPSHHPIIEGKVACSDCHNPHGALSPAMVKNESVNELCYSCHTDKRGPHLFEHPPVEENCLACHNSHGSIHNKLLNEKVPNLCQDCHDWSRHPGTPYGGNQGFPPGLGNTRFLARACVNCHQMVHGSNAPAQKGQFFLR